MKDLAIQQKKKKEGVMVSSSGGKKHITTCQRNIGFYSLDTLSLTTMWKYLHTSLVLSSTHTAYWVTFATLLPDEKACKSTLTKLSHQVNCSKFACKYMNLILCSSRPCIANSSASSLLFRCSLGVLLKNSLHYLS